MPKHMASLRLPCTILFGAVPANLMDNSRTTAQINKALQGPRTKGTPLSETARHPACGIQLRNTVAAGRALPNAISTQASSASATSSSSRYFAPHTLPGCLNRNTNDRSLMAICALPIGRKWLNPSKACPASHQGSANLNSAAAILPLLVQAQKRQ